MEVINLTEGTFSFSACEEAASVVTARCAARLDRGTMAFCLSGAKHRGTLVARLIIITTEMLCEGSRRDDQLFPSFGDC